MAHHEHESQPDFGTGQKKLSVYTFGFICCIILTVFAFWVILEGHFTKAQAFTLIYTAAIIQFIIQLVCFLRLNAQTPQGRTNILTFIFTGVILVTVIVGSLWIMWNLNYFMMN